MPRRPPSAAPKPRNEQAAALFARAGNAGQAIAVDTRPKIVRSRRHPDRAARKQEGRRQESLSD